MKREYFGMIFIFVSVTLLLTADYFIGEVAWDFLRKFIVIWTLIAYYAGQYAMRFPKAF